MNQQINEQLSALMDGELERDQVRFVLKRLAGSDELPQRWERYHLVRQSLRRQDMYTAPRGFAAAVMLRVEHEPAARTPGTLPIWLRWGAGGAIAASVAVAALLVTHPVGDAGPGPDGLPGPAAVVAGTPADAAPLAAAPAAHGGFRAPLQPVNAPVETAQVSFGPNLSQPVAIDPQLQSYLLRHYQSAGGAGQSTFVPYVLLGSPQPEANLPQAQEPAPRNR